MKFKYILARVAVIYRTEGVARRGYIYMIARHTVYDFRGACIASKTRRCTFNMNFVR